jgi:hypothetical protein
MDEFDTEVYESEAADEILEVIVAQPKSKARKFRSYTIKEKLDIVKYADENSVSAASKKFNVDRKSVRDWRGKHDEMTKFM